VIGNDSRLDIPNTYQPNTHLQQVKFQIIKLRKKIKNEMDAHPTTCKYWIERNIVHDNYSQLTPTRMLSLSMSRRQRTSQSLVDQV